ncbi:hypothetical protein KAU19_08195, partial [Candidatus Parcubacteria bacterium]|nr:hypothetical protein [Candidatus Parcubacteria bacterium]
SFAIDLLSGLTIKTVTADLPNNWRGSDDGGNHNQSNSKIAFDNAGYDYVVWQDTRQTGDQEIFGQKYNNDGDAQWPTDQRIRTANKNVLPDIFVDSMGDLYVCWNDDSNGNQDSYITKLNSSDGSEIWLPGVTTLSNSNKDEIGPQITVIDNGITATTTVVWQDNRNSGKGLDVYIQSIEHDGTLYLSNEKKANTDDLDSADQYAPVVTHDLNEYVYIAWTDGRNGDYDIYAQKYDTSINNLWPQEKQLVNEATNANQYSPSVGTDSNNFFYIAWTDERNGDKDVYLRKYDSNGGKQWASDLLVNSDGGSLNQHQPTIAIDTANIIYIAWTDERNGNQDIYAQKYDVNGNNLWTEDVRVNIDTGSSAQYNPDVTIDTSANPDTPYVTWQSDINGDFDIFASSFGEYTSITNISNVDITIVGAKKIGENPVIYKYNHNFTSNASGEIVLNNIEWDSYSIELQTGYTAYNIVMSDPAKPIDLEPNSAETITLYLE